VRLKIAVTPEKDQAAAVKTFLDLTLAAQSSPGRELTLVQPGVLGEKLDDVKVEGWIDAAPQSLTQPAGSPEDRINQITTQLDQIRAAVEALRGELRKDAAPAPPQK
jgi:hypothetical protein